MDDKNILVPNMYFEYSMVPGEGREPPCLAALDPKSSVSANSTSRAQIESFGCSLENLNFTF